MGIIELDGKKYVIGPLQQTHSPRLAPPFRTRGVQVRADDTSVNRFIHSGFPLGIGWSRMKRESERGVGGLLDSTCWTAKGPVTLGKLEESQTHSSPADHLIKAVNFRGNLWGIFEKDYSGATVGSVTAKRFVSSSNSWAGGGPVTSGPSSVSLRNVGVRAWDMVVHKDFLFAVVNNRPGSNTSIDSKFYCGKSADGSTWSNTGLASASANSYIPTSVARRNRIDDDMARLLSFGNELLMARYRHPDSSSGDGLIEVLSTTDSGTNWASDVTIPSGSGPKAFVSWYNLSGTRSPVLVTAEGIYAIDTSGDAFEEIYALDGDPGNGRWSEVGNDGALYVGLGSGQILRLSVLDTNTLEATMIGPPGDGLVFARQGHVSHILRTPSEWLFVAYGGHKAGTKASIFMIDTSVLLTDPETGKRFMPWHHFYQHGTADQDIATMAYSTASDGTPRLHFAIEGTSATANRHIAKPLTNPEQSSTIKYQASGVLQLPDDDMGDPQTTSMIFQGLIDVDDLSEANTGEYIQLADGLDGDSYGTNVRGDFLSGDKDLVFGDSEQGVAGKRWRGQLTLHRDSGDNTQTPKMHEFELQAQSVLVGKKRWAFEVDIEETAKQTPPNVSTNVDVRETIISNIETVAESTTLVTFQSAEAMVEARVRVPNDIPPVFDFEVVDSDFTNRGYRTGVVRVIVEQGV